MYIEAYVYIHVWGWLRLVGSFKLQVSFAEYSLVYRALLQKRLMILRSLLVVATPYVVYPRDTDTDTQIILITQIQTQTQTQTQTHGSLV